MYYAPPVKTKTEKRLRESVTDLTENVDVDNIKSIVWQQVDQMAEKPIYPAIVKRVLITANEETYYDELAYEDKYTEWLELRQGFIVAALSAKDQLIGIGDLIILDIAKRALMRAPRIRRCALILPLISYQGFTAQPKDYVEHFENINAFIEKHQRSSIKQTLLNW